MSRKTDINKEPKHVKRITVTHPTIDGERQFVRLPTGNWKYDWMPTPTEMMIEDWEIIKRE